MTAPKKRLASLDVLRGLDLWLLIIVGPLLGKIFSSMNFGVTIMLGCFAGEIIRSKGDEATPRKALILGGTGAALLAGGLSHVIDFTSVTISLIFGLEHHTGTWYPFIVKFGNLSILIIIMKILYDRKIFLKV